MFVAQNYRPGTAARVTGKTDEQGKTSGSLDRRIIPHPGWLVLSPNRLDHHGQRREFVTRLESLINTWPKTLAGGPARKPNFCSGCPHSTSTQVPEGSKAMAGIGCHGMASWLNADTSSLVQMGGEGANWTGIAPFIGEGHVFQNIGEGTWFHSGSLAIRQSVASGVNITYKILFNDAVAMTGGQQVDGPISVEAIAASCRAEGVERIAVVSDQPDRIVASSLPDGCTISHRDDLDNVQKELRQVLGVSVLIYAQPCATEKRRKEKRAGNTAPKTHAFINELICEGCGDCTTSSGNCLSVEPLKTPFGIKRKINNSTCASDLSCLKGYCPSFVTVTGKVKKYSAVDQPDFQNLASQLPVPEQVVDKPVWNILISGIGGTGTVSIAKLLAIAAMLDGRSVSLLDYTGFSQKAGSVLSHLRVAASSTLINQPRLSRASVDVAISGDLIVASGPQAMELFNDATQMVLNTDLAPTPDTLISGQVNFQKAARLDSICQIIDADNLSQTNASELAERYLGNTLFANIILVGYALQKGLLPLSANGLIKAICNGPLAVNDNLTALAIGRLLVSNPEAVALANSSVETGRGDGGWKNDFDRRSEFLAGYGGDAYAKAYASKVGRFHDRLMAASNNDIQSDRLEQLMSVVVKSLFQLSNRKDLFEVARLHTQGKFAKEIAGKFEDGASVSFHFASPVLLPAKGGNGRFKKRAIGSWVLPVLSLLARLRHLRDTPVDLLRFTHQRRTEHELLVWYGKLMDQCILRIKSTTFHFWLEIMDAACGIRGFGPVREQSVGAAFQKTDQLQRQLEEIEDGAVAVPNPLAPTLKHLVGDKLSSNLEKA